MSTFIDFTCICIVMQQQYKGVLFQETFFLFPIQNVFKYASLLFTCTCRMWNFVILNYCKSRYRRIGQMGMFIPASAYPSLDTIFVLKVQSTSLQLSKTIDIPVWQNDLSMPLAYHMDWSWTTCISNSHFWGVIIISSRSYVLPHQSQITVTCTCRHPRTPPPTKKYIMVLFCHCWYMISFVVYFSFI